MSETEAHRQLTNPSPPTASATPGIGVTILVATTTAANAVVPSKLFHRYVDLVAKGDEIWVSLGAAAALNVDKSKAGGATFALGTNVQNGVPIADGQRLRVRLDPTLHAQISWQANAANSKLLVYPTSQGQSTRTVSR